MLPDLLAEMELKTDNLLVQYFRNKKGHKKYKKAIRAMKNIKNEQYLQYWNDYLTNIRCEFTCKYNRHVYKHHNVTIFNMRCNVCSLCSTNDFCNIEYFY